MLNYNNTNPHSREGGNPYPQNFSVLIQQPLPVHMDSRLRGNDEDIIDMPQSNKNLA